MEMMIRKANKEDIDLIYGFERQYFIEHEPESLDRWEASKEKTVKFLISKMDQMFVVEEGQALYGYAYWDLQEGEACLYSIYVDNSQRGKGIGSNLVSAIEDQVAAKGYSVIKLQTLVTNSAQYLFGKMNYEFVKEGDGWLYYRKKFCKEMP